MPGTINRYRKRQKNDIPTNEGTGWRPDGMEEMGRRLISLRYPMGH